MKRLVDVFKASNTYDYNS